MKPLQLFATGAAIIGFAATSATLQAQTDNTWEGAHFGIFVGETQDVDDSSNDRFLFDTNLDGNYDNTVRTTSGADAFSPGFCNGAAYGRTPGERCNSNTHDEEWGIRAGYDWQRNNLVFGVMGEYARTGIKDSLAGFSTTPASYTMVRDVERIISLRARLGMSFGDNGNNLVYIVGGGARAKINNEFATTNGANTFTTSGNEDANGFQYGIGIERRIGDNVSIGLEYLDMEFENDDYRVRAGGPAPATNPFILVNAAGTDMRRSDTDLGLETVRATLTYRFSN